MKINENWYASAIKSKPTNLHRLELPKHRTLRDLILRCIDKCVKEGTYISPESYCQLAKQYGCAVSESSMRDWLKRKTGGQFEKTKR